MKSEMTGMCNASLTGRQHTATCARGFHAHFQDTTWVVYPDADEGGSTGWDTVYIEYLFLLQRRTRVYLCFSDKILIDRSVVYSVADDRACNLQGWKTRKQKRQVFLFIRRCPCLPHSTTNYAQLTLRESQPHLQFPDSYHRNTVALLQDATQ